MASAFKLCHRVEASLNGKDTPSPLRVLGLGTVMEYHAPNDTELIGAFKVYRPSVVEIHFPISDFDGFRAIRKSKKEMLKFHNMVIRWLAEDDTPVRTTNLQNIRFLSITEERDETGVPYERIVATMENVG